MDHHERGFTIVELLIAAAIVGILSAIAIWNYHEAIHRAKQRRTMADIRSLAQAWEARSVDAKAYNAAAYTIPAASVTASEMDLMLAPTYIKVVPKLDAWGHPFDFNSDYAVGTTIPSQHYSIRSAGRDGVYSGRDYAPTPTTNYDCDIVYSDGSFIVWPEGTQSVAH